MDSRQLKSKILLALLVTVSLSIVGSPAWANSYAEHELKLGKACYLNGNMAGAIYAYKSAIAIDPNLKRARTYLLQAYMNSHDYTSAILESSEILKAEPTNKSLWLVLASILQNSTARANVSDNVQDAIAAGANYPTAYFSLGVLLLDKKDYQGAADNFELALQKQPEFPGAHLKLSIALGNMGKTQEALNEVALAIDEQRTYPQAYAVRNQLLALARADQSVTGNVMSELVKRLTDVAPDLTTSKLHIAEARNF